MSGGSFDYVYHRHWDSEMGGFASIPADLVRMSEQMRQQGREDVAQVVDAYRLRLEARFAALMADAESMMGLLQAVEWWQSCDWDEARVDQELRDYQTKNPENPVSP